MKWGTIDPGLTLSISPGLLFLSSHIMRTAPHRQFPYFKIPSLECCQSLQAAMYLLMWKSSGLAKLFMTIELWTSSGSFTLEKALTTLNA